MHTVPSLLARGPQVVSIINGDMPDQVKVWVLSLMLSLVHPDKVRGGREGGRRPAGILEQRNKVSVQWK